MVQTKTKPISEQSDIELIRAVKKEASSEAFEEICRRTDQLFYKICHKYSSALASCGISFQDILNERDAVILQCIRSFKPSKKTKLSSHIGNYTRYLCLNSMNAKRIITVSPDEEVTKNIENQQICHDYFQNYSSNEENKNQIFNLVNKISDPRIKKIFKYRYSKRKKMIWSDIAKRMHTSPQTVMSWHRKGLSLLKEQVNSEK